MCLHNCIPGEPRTSDMGIPRAGTEVLGQLTVFSARVHDLKLECANCGGNISTGSRDEQPCMSCFIVTVPKVCGFIIGELKLSRGGEPLSVRVPLAVANKMFEYAAGGY